MTAGVFMLLRYYEYRSNVNYDPYGSTLPSDGGPACRENRHARCVSQSASRANAVSASVFIEPITDAHPTEVFEVQRYAEVRLSPTNLTYGVRRNGRRDGRARSRRSSSAA